MGVVVVAAGIDKESFSGVILVRVGFDFLTAFLVTVIPIIVFLESCGGEEKLWEGGGEEKLWGGGGGDGEKIVCK